MYVPVGDGVAAEDVRLLAALSDGGSRTVGVTGVIGSSDDCPFIWELSLFCEFTDKQTIGARSGHFYHKININ